MSKSATLEESQKHLFSEPSKRSFGRLKNQPVAKVGVKGFLEGLAIVPMHL
jgi:hypothetical protein